MKQSDLQEEVLRLVRSPEYRPVKPALIARQLKLDKEQAADLKKAIKRLIKQGQIKFGPSHLVMPLGSVSPVSSASTPARGSRPIPPPGKRPDDRKRQAPGLVTGIFKRAAAGYGFVRPRPAPGEPPVEDRSADIFIPLARTGDTTDGDLVTVRLLPGRREPGRGPAGEIVEVLERQKSRFVGRYEVRPDGGYVHIDGGAFTHPVYVGEGTAKNAGQGDTVVLEMVRYPTQAHEGEGVVVEVLGPRGAPGVDTLAIIREFDLPGEFPEDALEEARAQAGQFTEALGQRLDLTGATTITIDPVDARDFDDAISLERIESGHWRLGVHIADVSHFVPEASALDREARERGTSVYLPDRVIPMLPEIISNNLASLQPNRLRYTQTVFIELTADGAFVAATPHLAAIRSARRFTYEEVDDFLADRSAWRQKLASPVFDLLERMHELAMILRKRRMDRGSLELTLPEVKIDLNRDGQVIGAHVVKNTASHQMIEEFMLAANVAIAHFLTEAGVHFLRRVHDSPSPRKMQALTTFVRELGYPVENLQNRHELLQLVQAIADRPEARALHFAVLRSLAKAIYSPTEAGHFALNFDNYCHFTSPIRRYPDLTVHRLVRTLLQGKQPPTDFVAVALLGEHCSVREQRAERAERELIQVKLLNLLVKRIGWQMDAVITKVDEYGILVQGNELPAEGLVHVSALHNDHYDYDASTHQLVGRRRGHRFRLGDLVRVEVVQVDVGKRELEFRLVQTLAAAPPPPPRLPPAPDDRPRDRQGRRRNSAAASGPKPDGENRGGRHWGEAPRKRGKSGSRKTAAQAKKKHRKRK